MRLENSKVRYISPKHQKSDTLALGSWEMETELLTPTLIFFYQLHSLFTAFVKL